MYPRGMRKGRDFWKWGGWWSKAGGDKGKGEREEVGLDVSRNSWGRAGAGMDGGFLDCGQREVLKQGSTVTTAVGRLKEEILSLVSCLLSEHVDAVFSSWKQAFLLRHSSPQILAQRGIKMRMVRSWCKFTQLQWLTQWVWSLSSTPSKKAYGISVCFLLRITSRILSRNKTLQIVEKRYKI